MRVLALSFLLAALAAAQSSVKVAPDCASNIKLDGDGRTAVLDVRSLGCNVWVASWENAPPSGSLSVTVESAPTSSNLPGAWVTYTGSVSAGCTNPCTDEVGTLILSGYVSWISISATGVNQLRGRLLGWKDPAVGGSGGVIPNPLPVDIVSPSPVPISGTIDVTQSQACESQASITYSGTSRLEIVPASGSLIPKICAVVLSSDTATTITFHRGTGANCGTGTTTLASFPSVLGIGIDAQANRSNFSANVAANAICISSSVSATIGGIVFYHY